MISRDIWGQSKNYFGLQLKGSEPLLLIYMGSGIIKDKNMGSEHSFY